MSRSPRPAAAVLLGTVATASLWTVSSALAATRGVEVRDRAYAPAEVEIAPGDTVRWTWVGEEPHSVTSFGAFDSHPNCTQLTPDQCGRTGATFSWTATEPGTVSYVCRIHGEEMQGTITVTAAAEPTTSPAPASPSPSPAPRPSPSPSPRPTATAAPAPDDDEPAPATSPSPRPTRRSAPSLGVGEATEVPGSPTPTEDAGEDVAAPLVSDVSPEPLEPFPAPPSPSPSPDPVADDVVAIGEPAGSGRQAVRIAGAVALAVTVLTFGRVVLFGRPWA